MPYVINALDSPIIWSALQNRVTTSWTIRQEMDMFTAYPVSTPHEPCVYVFRNVAYQLIDHYFGFSWQFNIERDGDSGTPNKETGYKNNMMSSFQTIPGSAFSILMAVYIFGVSKKTACSLIAFDISIEALYLVWWFGKPLGSRHAHL